MAPSARSPSIGIGCKNYQFQRHLVGAQWKRRKPSGMRRFHRFPSGRMLRMSAYQWVCQCVASRVSTSDLFFAVFLEKLTKRSTTFGWNFRKNNLKNGAKHPAGGVGQKRENWTNIIVGSCCWQSTAAASAFSFFLCHPVKRAPCRRGQKEFHGPPGGAPLSPAQTIDGCRWTTNQDDNWRHVSFVWTSILSTVD